MARRAALWLALLGRTASAANYVGGQCVVGVTSGDLFPDKCEYGTQFTQTVAADYSLLWEVAYYDSYKFVKNGKTGAVHALFQCGVDAPTDLPAYAADATLVSVPVTKVATTSTTYLPFIEMLGERRALKAFQSSFAWASSPCLRKMHRDGLIEAQADWVNPDLEALGIDVTFADSWGMTEHNAVELTDTSEEMPNAVLKTAEYVEYVGLYFNREKEASAAIAHMVENWLCTKAAVAGVVQDKAPVKVLWAQYNAGGNSWSPKCADGSEGGWSIASANTWYSEIIEAAGGILIVPDVAGDCESNPGTAWATPYLSTAQLLEVGADAAVMISPGPFPADQDISSLPAYGNGHVFDNQGPNGANDWFERRVVEPDAVLQDLAVAFYPDAAELEGLSRKWLRDVVADEPIGGVSDEDLDTACPDIDAPYEFSSTDMCARLVTVPDEPTDPAPTTDQQTTEGSSSSKKNSPNAASGGIIAVAVIASALVLLLVVGGLLYYANRRLPPPAKALHADDLPVIAKAAETS